MANLNLSTVELVSTLRAAPQNGSPSSQDYNDSWTESLADLAALSGFINEILIPMLDGLNSAIMPNSLGVPHGLEGRYIFSDTSDLTTLFFDGLSTQPLSIADSLRILNGMLQTSQSAINTLNVEVTALQTQLSSTNQNDIAQALQNFSSTLQSVSSQTVNNTITIQNSLITLQTGGVNNPVQNKLNLIGGTNVTLVNSGGDVTISAPIVTSAIQFLIDGGGAVPTTGIWGQISIPYACTIKSWTLTSDISGSAVIDLLRSTYSGFPTTASIAGTDKPTLASVQKNTDSTLTGWGSTALNAGDELQINLNSVTTCQRLNLTVKITVP